MVFVVSSGGTAGDFTALGQAGFTGDVTALFPRQFSAVFNAHYQFQRYFRDEWLAGSKNVMGYNSATVERMGDTVLRLYNRGYNVNVPASGGTAVSESIKRDRYIYKVDDEPSVQQTVWTKYDAQQSADGGRSFMSKTGSQYAANLAKANDLNAISTVLQTASLPDYAYGGSSKTKLQAAQRAWGNTVGADGVAGLIVDANLDSADFLTAGNAVEDFLARCQIHYNTLEQQGRRIAMMGQLPMYNWLRATGRIQSLTAAISAIPTRAAEYGDQAAYGKGFITNWRGFEIHVCPWLDALGDEMDAHFNATDFGGAAGSKYMPGSSYNSTNTNKMAVHRIATQADLANGVFEQNAGASNPSQWSSAAHYTALAFNKVRILTFCPSDAINELVVIPPFGTSAPIDELSVKYFAAKLNGFGPEKGEAAFYAASAKG